MLVIIALGIAMAARKQFVVDFPETWSPWAYSVIESHEKELGHIHPRFTKNAWAPPIMTWPSYQMYYSLAFNVISVVLYWIIVIALVVLIFRRIGFDYYASIVLTMFVLFIGNLAGRELLNIHVLQPAPHIGYQVFNFRMPVVPLSLASILLVLQGRLILSGVLLGLMSMIHIKYGLRMFGLIMGCMVLWNLWGCRWANVPQLKMPWRSVAGFGCCWIVLSVGTYLYITDSLKSDFAGLDVPRAVTPFLTRLGWAIKNEPDDYLISYYFNFNDSFFGFLFLAISTILLSELIRRHMYNTRIKIVAVVLMLSVFIAMAFFAFGFLFEKFLIDILPLFWSHNIMLARVWDLIWVVVIAFTMAVFLCALLWAEGLDRKFQKFPFTIRQLFLHAAFTGFVLFNVYIFVDKKDGVIFRELDLSKGVRLNISYTQICTEDTALYEETLDRLWKLGGGPNEPVFHEQLQVLESIFERNLKSVETEKTYNPDVQTLSTLHNLKSNRYHFAIKELMAAKGGSSPYLWHCDEKGAGLHRVRVKIPFKDFYDVSQWVNKNTPSYKGVITPPYIAEFANFSQRVSFWDFKADQHQMYLIEDYYPIGLRRLQALTGLHGVLIAPGFRNGIVGLRGRAYFLSLQQEDLRRLREDYPHYDYLITENQALHGFPKLYANASFAVYDISEKKG